MERHSLFLVLTGLIMIYWAAQAPSQYFEDPTLFYKNMTFDFDVRLRGEVAMPRCVRELMNCWDVMRPDIVCAHERFFATACGVMRHRLCHELALFGDSSTGEDRIYNTFQLFESFCPDKQKGDWT